MVFPKLPKPSSSSSYIFKAMIFFFLDFSKAPKVVVFSFMVFSKAPKAMLFSSFFPKLHGDGFFFFMVKTSKSWSSFSWFCPKFPKSSSYWPCPQSHGLVLLEFFQSSQSYCLHLGFSKGSMIVVFLCCFWLLVNMPIVLLNSLIICSFDIFELSPFTPPMFSVLIIKSTEGGGG